MGLENETTILSGRKYEEAKRMQFPGNSTKLIRRIVVFLTVLLPVSAVQAQVSTGSILGSVTDPSGAVVTGATITITNAGTNVAFTSGSNGSGLYTVPNLPAGRYRVDVISPNFQTESVEGVILDVGEQRTVNFKLKVGNANAKVVVTATTAAVDLDNAIVMPVANE